MSGKTEASAGSHWLALLRIAVVMFAALAWRLPDLVVSDPDEGTYVYAGRLLAQGRLPYKDFLFAQPPGIVALTAGAWVLTGGSLFVVRLLFVALTLSALIPMF